MHHPTDDLRAEHTLLEQAMSVLTGIRNHVAAARSFPVKDAAEVLRFLREFLVGNHFRKENAVIWPAVAMHGTSRVAGAVGDLMRLQEEIVELIGTLVFFWEPFGELTAVERQGFADTVDALSTRVQQMLQSEEQLLCACDQVVPGDDQIDWLAQFRAFDARSPAAHWRTPLAQLALRWTD